jgi:hypothetical protein
LLPFCKPIAEFHSCMKAYTSKITSIREILRF